MKLSLLFVLKLFHELMEKTSLQNCGNCHLLLKAEEVLLLVIHAFLDVELDGIVVLEALRQFCLLKNIRDQSLCSLLHVVYEVKTSGLYDLE